MAIRCDRDNYEIKFVNGDYGHSYTTVTPDAIKLNERSVLEEALKTGICPLCEEPMRQVPDEY